MKLLFSPKEKIIFAAAVFILILYIVLLQFYFLSPLKSDLKVKQQTLQTEQKLVETMQQKQTGNNETWNENTTELQKEIPVKPLQDQFILDLQQAEAVSDSQIKSMSFADGGQAAAASTQTATTSSSTQTQADTSTSQTNTSGGASQQQNAQTTSGAGGQQNTQNPSTAQTPSQPAVSKLTVQLSIESQHYEDLEKFINTLEGLKRITVVEAINYTGNSEITSLDQESKSLTYTLTVTAYYLPGLPDLEKQLPKVDYPAPANKENPLSQFANTQMP
jgi:type IV pilus assembly protein PilO